MMNYLRDGATDKIMLLMEGRAELLLMVIH
jgi:hypothetical protein